MPHDQEQWVIDTLRRTCWQRWFYKVGQHFLYCVSFVLEAGLRWLRNHVF